MAAISQVIPNLLGGVSQQPDPLKLPGQVREAKNVLLDPTFGCRKRPPTRFIARLATDVPKDAKWFHIFRDDFEKYVVALYKDQNEDTVLRVWEGDSGAERTVNITDTAASYLKYKDKASINALTINDYTFLCNSEKIVSMDTNSLSDGRDDEALVVINQVAYNTTYAIDFLKDGQNTTQEKVYRASKLSVSPATFEDSTDGNCGKASSQAFVENGSGTGLGFTLTTSCNPTQVTGEDAGATYPTTVYNNTQSAIDDGSIDYGLQGYCTYWLGKADEFAPGSYLYRQFTGSTASGYLTVRMEVRVTTMPFNPPGYGGDTINRFDFVGASIVSYGTDGEPWVVNRQVLDKVTLSQNLPRWGNGDYGFFPAGSTVGVRITVDNVSTAPSTPSYEYKSVYNSRVTLNNGGSGWRVGDSVTVNMAGQTYTIRVEAETFGYNYASEAQVLYTSPLDTTAGTLDVGAITGGLTSSINALPEYSATPVGNVIHITRTDGRDFNIQTRGGTTNNALYALKGSVNDISLLPNQCVPDVILMVRNSADSDADDYYVRFIPSSGDIPGQGAWEETVKPGVATDLNPSTMPVAMIRESNGDFTVRPLAESFDDTLFWAGRDVGDEKTNPDPSFVGKSIKDMFFYMNRLGFLSSDSVVLSQPGDYFNFFVGSAIAVSDADPIDMTASSTKPATLRAAIGTPKGLLLFAENSQFLLATNEAAFGPSTVKMTELSNYSYNSQVQPLETGVSVLFATQADTFSKVYEMAVDSIDNRPLVSENTRICPEYIPPSLTISTASPNNSLCIYGNGSETLWTFKFFNTGNERSLAGWSKWVMPAPVNLIAFSHDTGYLVLNNDGDSVLLKMEMLDDPRTSPITAFGSKFTPRLDHYLFKSQVVIEDVTATENIVRFPAGSYVEGTQPTIILTVDGNSTLYRSPAIEQDPTGYYITVEKGLTTNDFIVGLEYTMSVELPSFYVTSEKKPDRKNSPVVEAVYLDLYYSGRYQVTLSRQGYEDRSIDLDVTDADIYFANAAAIDEVASRVIPVYCRGDLTRLSISASDPLPASITSYRWEGHYNTRGISVIQ